MAGSVYTHVLDEGLIERSGSVYTHTRGTPVINLFLRGAQFRVNTFGDDRFVSRLTSVLSTTSTVNLTATGTTSLFTVPASNTALIHGVVLRATLGSATTDATVSLGINPSTINLFDLEPLVSFRNTNDVWSLWSDKTTTLIAQGNSQIDFDVTTAATGGSLNADIYLIGFLI